MATKITTAPAITLVTGLLMTASHEALARGGGAFGGAEAFTAAVSAAEASSEVVSEVVAWAKEEQQAERVISLVEER
jgi:hypothetical protein